MTMISYHNSPELKARFVGHVERHRAQDQVARGTYGTVTAGGKWRGCAVGCSLRSLDEIDGRQLVTDNNNHRDLAERLGIPLVLAHLEDRIFEGLPESEALLWPTLFAQAIPVGADLSLVWPRFAHWMLVDATAGVTRFARSDRTREAIKAVAKLFQRQLDGGSVSPEEWRAARSAAAYAADAAAYAAYAADAAAYAADAAAYAADAAAAAAADDAAAAAADAADAADDAADAAADDDAAAAAAAAADDAADARTRHFRTMAEALLRFMAEAPVVK
jgi:hypothetical protein